MDFVRGLISWILALGLVFLFFQATLHLLPDPPAGQVKLLDPPGTNIIFQTLAERSGITLFEPTGRVVTAYLELLAALLLLFPFSRRWGAFLAFCILGGAVGFHLSPWLGREVPLALSQNAPTDGGELFMLAIAMLVASLLIMFIHPPRRRRR